MKHTLLMLFISTVIAALTSLCLCKWYYTNKLKAEFKRGLFTGIEYHSKYGVYPSYYHWNKKFDNPDFNMDTIETYQSRTGDVILRTEPFIFPDSFHNMSDGELIHYYDTIPLKDRISMEEVKRLYQNNDTLK